MDMKFSVSRLNQPKKGFKRMRIIKAVFQKFIQFLNWFTDKLPELPDENTVILTIAGFFAACCIFTLLTLYIYCIVTIWDFTWDKFWVIFTMTFILLYCYKGYRAVKREGVNK